jgi:hypothetical protein
MANWTALAEFEMEGKSYRKGNTWVQSDDWEHDEEFSARIVGESFTTIYFIKDAKSKEEEPMQRRVNLPVKPK